MTSWNATFWALVFYFFCQRWPILVKNNGNNKRIECVSNDSTIFISILLCLRKEFHIVYNCYQCELGHV